MNPDFAEMLAALSAAGAEYLVVGAHAVAAHGHPRATGDLDLWVRPAHENAGRVYAALQQFGAPLGELMIEDLETADLVYQIGVPPRRIDILTSISGVTFDEAWPTRTTVTLGGQLVPILGKECLIKNKRAAGRPRDLADVADLEGSIGV